ncbi:MAG TPA: DUF3027 domain-containing protein [Streptosporangiaceae bacterium]|nr:DUF3027 domain-containing protein [Streptosporangiaceae bacterium]
MRTREPDEVCAQAVDLALAAATEVAGEGRVGDHVGVEAEGERVVTHLFGCLDPAYRGWRWAVTLTRASRSKTVTVSESLLLPGPDSILAPEWVPWRERLRPGDLGVGDIMPASEDDERLVPMAVLEGEDGLADWTDAGLMVGWVTPPAEGSGTDQTLPVPPQARVLSAAGRDDAALRWYTSEHGPRSPLAHAAPGTCVGCGFFARLSGPLGQVFGVCANAYAPDDGRVVSVDHGCGAHSEALLPPGTDHPVAPVIDELGYDLMDLPGVTVEETVFESLDHG